MDEKVFKILTELLAGKDEKVLASRAAFEAALRERGCTEEEIRALYDGLSDAPLDDDDLAEVSGGGSVVRAAQRDVPRY